MPIPEQIEDRGCLLFDPFLFIIFVGPAFYCSWAYFIPIREAMAAKNQLACWAAYMIIPASAGGIYIYKKLRQ